MEVLEAWRQATAPAPPPPQPEPNEAPPAQPPPEEQQSSWVRFGKGFLRGSLSLLDTATRFIPVYGSIKGYRERGWVGAVDPLNISGAIRGAYDAYNSDDGLTLHLLTNYTPAGPIGQAWAAADQGDNGLAAEIIGEAGPGIILTVAVPAAGRMVKVSTGAGRAAVSNAGKTAKARLGSLSDNGFGQPYGTPARGRPANGGQGVTRHGAERLADPTRLLTPAEEAATRASHSLRANNGATVYIHQVVPGKFNVIIEGQGGFMTRFRHLRIEAVRRMAIKYEWTAP